MLKYLSKFALDILPSVAATIIGAYIVNHYITNKPAADASAAVSSIDATKAAGKNDAPPAIVANIPAAGIRAKGISEKSIADKADKSAAEKPAAEKAAEKPIEKSEPKPTETAGLPRHPPVPREKTAAKSIPVQPAVAPVVAPPAVAPAVEAAIVPDEHRDANDLARAAIERLRGVNEGAAHQQDAVRPVEPPRTAAVVPVRPLPPPVMVSSPAGETLDSMTASVPTVPSDAVAATDDARRLTPPADIPDAKPLDLRADANVPAPRKRTVADDMLSAAKSVFHSVLPQ
jgi:hypothetical protein